MNLGERRLLDVMAASSWVLPFADPDRRVIEVEPYVYAIPRDGNTGLAFTTASGDHPANLVMNNDSDFVCTYLSGAAVISAPEIDVPANGNRVLEFSPSLLVQLTNQSEGDTWFNRPHPLPLVCGAGGFPFILASPRVIRAKSTMTVTFTAQAAGVTFSELHFAMGGARIYYASDPGARPF